MNTPEPHKTEAVMPHVESTLKQEQLPTQRIKPLYRGTQVIWYIIAMIEILLVIRFFLKLLGANPQAGFTQFIYGATQLLAGPFLVVFRVSRVEGSVFEWSTLLAIAIYFLFAWIVVKGLIMSKPVSTKEADQKLPEQG